MIKLLRFILAIPVTIAFIPFALLICLGVAIFLLLPEMISDCFEEIVGK